MQRENNKATIRSAVNFVAAGFFMTISNPVDLIRIRMQTMTELVEVGALQRSYEGIIDCIKRVKHEEGLRAFWKGNGANVLRFYSSQTLNFLSKQYIKNFLSYFSIFNHSSQFGTNMLAGILGSWLSLGLVYPIEYTRNQISNNISQQNSSIIKMMIKTVKTQGFRALYTGSAIMMVGVAVFRGVYFGVFDTFKGDKEGLARWGVAYIASFLSLLVTYPSNTIRQRLICSQTFKQKYSGFSDCSRQIYQKEGLGSFIRGYQVVFLQSLLRSFILFFYDRIAQDLQQGADN